MGCTVHLQGPLSSLQIRDLTACTVVGGPVTGPTFVHGKHLLYSLHLNSPDGSNNASCSTLLCSTTRNRQVATMCDMHTDT